MEQLVEVHATSRQRRAEFIVSRSQQKAGAHVIVFAAVGQPQAKQSSSQPMSTGNGRRPTTHSLNSTLLATLSVFTYGAWALRLHRSVTTMRYVYSPRID